MFCTLYKLYNSLCPFNRPTDVFYLKPLKKPKEGCWYSSVALGHNTLRITVGRLCKKAGIHGVKTDHSLRTTSCCYTAISKRSRRATCNGAHGTQKCRWRQELQNNIVRSKGGAVEHTQCQQKALRCRIPLQSKIRRGKVYIQTIPHQGTKSYLVPYSFPTVHLSPSIQ